MISQQAKSKRIKTKRSYGAQSVNERRQRRRIIFEKSRQKRVETVHAVESSNQADTKDKSQEGKRSASVMSASPPPLQNLSQNQPSNENVTTTSTKGVLPKRRSSPRIKGHTKKSYKELVPSPESSDADYIEDSSTDTNYSSSIDDDDDDDDESGSEYQPVMSVDDDLQNSLFSDEASSSPSSSNNNNDNSTHTTENASNNDRIDSNKYVQFHSRRSNKSVLETSTENIPSTQQELHHSKRSRAIKRPLIIDDDTPSSKDQSPSKDDDVSEEVSSHSSYTEDEEGKFSDHNNSSTHTNEDDSDDDEMKSHGACYLQSQLQSQIPLQEDTEDDEDIEDSSHDRRRRGYRQRSTQVLTFQKKTIPKLRKISKSLHEAVKKRSEAKFELSNDAIETSSAESWNAESINDNDGDSTYENSTNDLSREQKKTCVINTKGKKRRRSKLKVRRKRGNNVDEQHSTTKSSTNNNDPPQMESTPSSNRSLASPTNKVKQNLDVPTPRVQDINERSNCSTPGKDHSEYDEERKEQNQHNPSTASSPIPPPPQASQNIDTQNNNDQTSVDLRSCSRHSLALELSNLQKAFTSIHNSLTTSKKNVSTKNSKLGEDAISVAEQIREKVIEWNSSSTDATESCTVETQHRHSLDDEFFTNLVRDLLMDTFAIFSKLEYKFNEGIVLVSCLIQSQFGVHSIEDIYSLYHNQDGGSLSIDDHLLTQFWSEQGTLFDGLMHMTSKIMTFKSTESNQNFDEDNITQNGYDYIVVPFLYCLHAIPIHMIVERLMLSAELDKDREDYVWTSLSDFCVSIPTMMSVPIFEAALAFIHKLHCQLLERITKSQKNSKEAVDEVTISIVMRLHGILHLNLREDIDRVGPMLPNTVYDKLYPSHFRKSQISFMEWSRGVITSVQQIGLSRSIASFVCNGVYAPAADGIGTQIATVPTIDLNRNSMTLFCFKRGSHNSFESEESIFPRDRKLVNFDFSMFSDRFFGTINEKDCTLTLSLKYDDWVDSGMGGISSSSFSMSQRVKFSPHHEGERTIRLFIKRNEFSSFVDALRDRGLALQDDSTYDEFSSSASGLMTLSSKKSKFSVCKDENTRDHVEFSTRIGHQCKAKFRSITNQLQDMYYHADGSILDQCEQPEEAEEDSKHIHNVKVDPLSQQSVNNESGAEDENHFDGSASAEHLQIPNLDDNQSLINDDRAHPIQPTTPLKHHSQPSKKHPLVLSTAHHHNNDEPGDHQSFQSPTRSSTAAEVTPLLFGNGAKGNTIEQSTPISKRLHFDYNKRPLELFSALAASLGQPKAMEAALGKEDSQMYKVADVVTSIDEILANAQNAMMDLDRTCKLLSSMPSVLPDTKGRLAWVSSCNECVQRGACDWNSLRSGVEDDLLLKIFHGREKTEG